MVFCNWWQPHEVCVCILWASSYIYSNIITASYIHERRVITYICTNDWVVSIICHNFTSFLFGKNDIEIFKILSSHLWCVSSNVISSDNEAVGYISYVDIMWATLQLTGEVNVSSGISNGYIVHYVIAQLTCVHIVIM